MEERREETEERPGHHAEEPRHHWTPIHLLEKLFPGIGHHHHPNGGLKKNHDSIATTGSKLHPNSAPIVTLYFDVDRNISIAVLSRHVPALDVYFQCRVAQGTAVQRSPLYYELEGYIRENLAKIRRQRGFSLESICVAIGSERSSDDAQKAELEARRSHNLEERHSSSETDNDVLERVLEIARMHRLSEDLDVMSIYFMRQTSKVFGKTAAKIAKTRMSELKLSLSPYCDGVFVSGYSKFVRGDSSPELVRSTESGRIVEYQKKGDINLAAARPGIFVPRALPIRRFSWKCEEIALENLHRWWGDILTRDYVGHKLVLMWTPEPGSADSILLKPGNTHLKTFRLEAGPSRGRRTWPKPEESLASLTLHVEKSKSAMVDEATTVYEGLASVEELQVNFSCLVRASARTLLGKLKATNKQLILERPLCDYEVHYLGLVEEAAEF